MAQQFERARRVATTGRMVLLTGPTGSGRRTARWIHELSGLKGSFVEILAREFIESLGAFREAQGGTLLITDIEELEGEALSALPRALANQELLALEHGEELRVRLVISGGPKAERALSSALQSAIGEEVLQLPPLSHRLEDLGSLVSVFLVRFEAVESVKLRRSVARALVLHDWPGG